VTSSSIPAAGKEKQRKATERKGTQRRKAKKNNEKEFRKEFCQLKKTKGVQKSAHNLIRTLSVRIMFPRWKRARPNKYYDAGKLSEVGSNEEIIIYHLIGDEEVEVVELHVI